MLAEYGLTVSNFLVTSAVEHFRKTGRTVRGFIVTPAMWEQLMQEPKTQKTKLSYMLEVDGFDIISSPKLRPMLIEDRNQKGIHLL